MILTLLAAITLAIVLVGGFDMARGNRSTSYLKDAPCYSGPHPPKVSIIIPARNEAKKIAEALQSVLKQDYPNLEFIVLNDRSTDNTAAILAGIAARDPRLRVENISELPAGWLGEKLRFVSRSGASLRRASSFHRRGCGHELHRSIPSRTLSPS